MLFKKKKIKEKTLSSIDITDIVFGVIEIIIEIIDAVLDAD